MWPAPCSCATEMKRMPARGKRSSASMYAEPTMPNTSVTPRATSVSTKASDGVIFCLPATTVRPDRFWVSVMVFIGISYNDIDNGRSLMQTLGERLRRLDIRVAERVGDRLAGDFAERDVETVPQVRVVCQRLLPALVGEHKHEGQRRVVQGESGGARNA